MPEQDALIGYITSASILPSFGDHGFPVFVNGGEHLIRINSVLWFPAIDDKVLIAYPNDCRCRKSLIDCVCMNVWFPGTVESELIYDREKKCYGFNVIFDEGGDDHVEWDKGGKNARWLLSG